MGAPLFICYSQQSLKISFGKDFIEAKRGEY